MLKHFKYLIGSTFLLLILTNGSHGQTLEWSAPEKQSLNYLKIIGEDEDGFFVLRSNMPLTDFRQSGFFRKREYSLSYYTDDMKLSWTKVIEPFQKNYKAEAVLFVGDHPMVVCNYIDTDTKQYKLFAQSMNNKGEYSSGIQQIATVSFQRKGDINEMDYMLSKDRHKVALIQRWIKNGVESQFYNVAVMNDKLAVEWNKLIEIPLNEKAYRMSNTTLTNEGDFVLMGERNIKVTGKPRQYYTIMSYNHSKDSLFDTDISFEGKQLTGATFTFDNLNKRAVVAGFYSDKTNYSSAGIFFSAVNLSNGEIHSSGIQPFAAQFLNRFLGEKKIDNRELTNYFMDKLILRNDGGAVLVAENYYTTTSSYYDYFTRSYITRVNYHYNNVLVVSVNVNGTIDWPQLVNKTQTSTDDNGFYSSYSSLPYQDKIYFVYNDLSGRRNRVQTPYVTNKGEFHNNTLLTESDEAVLVPKAAKQVDENTVIMPAERKGKLCFVKISF